MPNSPSSGRGVRCRNRPNAIFTRASGQVDGGPLRCRHGLCARTESVPTARAGRRCQRQGQELADTARSFDKDDSMDLSGLELDAGGDAKPKWSELLGDDAT